jgi:hypothetical protein
MLTPFCIKSLFPLDSTKSISPDAGHNPYALSFGANQIAVHSINIKHIQFDRFIGIAFKPKSLKDNDRAKKSPANLWFYTLCSRISVTICGSEATIIILKNG